MLSGVAIPSIARSHQWAAREREEARQTVQEYYERLKQAQPYVRLGVSLEKLTPKLPSRPPILDWLDRVERWGFPNPGTWLDQPILLLAQLEGAREGKEQALSEEESPTSDVFSQAPPPKPLMKG